MGSLRAFLLALTGRVAVLPEQSDVHGLLAVGTKGVVLELSWRVAFFSRSHDGVESLQHL